MERLKFFERDSSGNVIMYSFSSNAVKIMNDSVKQMWKNHYEVSEMNWMKLSVKDAKDGEMLLKNEDFRRVLYGE